MQVSMYAGSACRDAVDEIEILFLRRITICRTVFHEAGIILGNTSEDCCIALCGMKFPGHQGKTFCIYLIMLLVVGYQPGKRLFVVDILENKAPLVPDRNNAAGHRCRNPELKSAHRHAFL